MTAFTRRQFISAATSSLLLRPVYANTHGSTGLVLDDRFSQHQISTAHPESPARFAAIKKQLIKSHLFNRLTLIKPKQDVEAWLHSIHSDQHINRIKSAQFATHKNALLATAGLLAAVDAVCNKQVNNAFCASRPPRSSCYEHRPRRRLLLLQSHCHRRTICTTSV